MAYGYPSVLVLAERSCVDGEEAGRGKKKQPAARILEEPAQPPFLPSAVSYRLFHLQVMGPILLGDRATPPTCEDSRETANNE